MAGLKQPVRLLERLVQGLSLVSIRLAARQGRIALRGRPGHNLRKAQVGSPPPGLLVSWMRPCTLKRFLIYKGRCDHSRVNGVLAPDDLREMGMRPSYHRIVLCYAVVLFVKQVAIECGILPGTQRRVAERRPNQPLWWPLLRQDEDKRVPDRGRVRDVQDGTALVGGDEGHVEGLMCGVVPVARLGRHRGSQQEACCDEGECRPLVAVLRGRLPLLRGQAAGDLELMEQECSVAWFLEYLDEPAADVDGPLALVVVVAIEHGE